MSDEMKEIKARYNIDGKITEVRKSIEEGKKAFETELLRYQDMIKTVKVESGAQITNLQKAIQEKDAKISELSFNVETLKNQITQLKTTIGTRDTQIESLQRELTVRENVLETTNLKVQKYEEELRILNDRLTEEQMRHTEIIQMKSNDFELMKKELGQEVENWRTECQKRENQIMLTQENRQELKKELENLLDELKRVRYEAKEHLKIKEEQITGLKDEFAMKENTWQTVLKEKASEIESLKSSLDEMIKEMVTKY